MRTIARVAAGPGEKNTSTGSAAISEIRTCPWLTSPSELRARMTIVRPSCTLASQGPDERAEGPGYRRMSMRNRRNLQLGDGLGTAPMQVMNQPHQPPPKAVFAGPFGKFPTVAVTKIIAVLVCRHMAYFSQYPLWVTFGPDAKSYLRPKGTRSGQPLRIGSVMGRSSSIRHKLRGTDPGPIAQNSKPAPIPARPSSAKARPCRAATADTFLRPSP